jgi:hypothetical protein
MMFGHRDPQGRARNRLAAGLGRLEEEPGPSFLSSATPVRQDAVAACREQLRELAYQLAGPGPVASDGVQLVDELLTDPASPLYTGGPAELADAVAAARRALQVEPREHERIG